MRLLAACIASLGFHIGVFAAFKMVGVGKTPIRQGSVDAYPVTLAGSGQVHRRNKRRPPLKPSPQAEERSPIPIIAHLSSMANEQGLDSLGNKEGGQDYFEEIQRVVASRKKYPGLSVRLREEGIVKVGFEISVRGELLNAEILEECRFPRLNKAALELIRSIQYFPEPPAEFFSKGVKLSLPIAYRLH
jgi:TonB family protein